MASSAALVSGGMPSASKWTPSGSHCEWKRGASTAARASIPNAVAFRMIWCTVLMIVLPPGDPVTSTVFPFRTTIAGLIEESIRLPGRIRFGAVPMSPIVFVSPAFLLKSPISLLSRKPAPDTTTRDPYPASRV